MTQPTWRVAIITSVAPIAHAFTDALRAMGHEVLAVLTPRRRRPMPADLGLWDATAPAGLDVLVARNKWSMEPLLRAVRPDLVLCFGFPWLIPAEALAVPPLGVVNLHPALLPRHRGPIPTSWAIRAGDATYGVTWHYMDAQFDTGNILAQAPVPMEPDDSDIRVVGPRLIRAAIEILPQALARVAAGDPGDPQHATGDEPYAGWFEDAYAELDLAQGAIDVDRQVRAWSLVGPGAFPAPTLAVDGRRLLVRRVSLSDPGDVDGVIRLEAADGPVWIVESAPIDEGGADAEGADAEAGAALPTEPQP
jgi:methionyl-tRNA formyltransferase